MLPGRHLTPIFKPLFFLPPFKVVERKPKGFIGQSLGNLCCSLSPGCCKPYSEEKGKGSSSQGYPTSASKKEGERSDIFPASLSTGLGFLLQAEKREGRSPEEWKGSQR